MEELLKRLEISESNNPSELLEKLKEKQVEYLERIDNVEDEKRKQQLNETLMMIEMSISSLSFIAKKNSAGIQRDLEDEPKKQEDFSNLKKQKNEEKNTINVTEQSMLVTDGKTEEELLDEALALLATNNYSEGIIQIEELADSGYHVAQYQLGKMYFEGNRVVKNEEKAQEWYQKAAEQGNAVAQYNLGWMYDNGRGVSQNDAKAVEWYQKAAEQGSVFAQYYLGVMYEKGRGVLQNDLKACEWFQKAADQGNDDAQLYLGWMYNYGRGVSQNEAKAVEWYKKAAEQGNATAQKNMGIMYQNGSGVVEDKDEAKRWFLEAKKTLILDEFKRFKNTISVKYSEKSTTRADKVIFILEKLEEYAKDLKLFEEELMYRTTVPVGGSARYITEWREKARKDAKKDIGKALEENVISERERDKIKYLEERIFTGEIIEAEKFEFKSLYDNIEKKFLEKKFVVIKYSDLFYEYYLRDEKVKNYRRNRSENEGIYNLEDKLEEMSDWYNLLRDLPDDDIYSLHYLFEENKKVENKQVENQKAENNKNERVSLLKVIGGFLGK